MTNKEFQQLGKRPRTLYIEILDDFDGSVLKKIPSGSVVPSGRSYREIKTKVMNYTEACRIVGNSPF